MERVSPFGLEPQRILRLEKMHILVGQDTDSESNPLEAAMPWIVKLDKDDFVGKWSMEHVQERGLQWMLVGFEMENGRVPLEGGQVVLDGKSAGRVTSVRWSEELQKVIGMAVVPDRRSPRTAPCSTSSIDGIARAGDRRRRSPSSIPTERSSGHERARLPQPRTREGRPRLRAAAQVLDGAPPARRGARFEERDGWLVPISIPGEADRLGRVGIGDLSHLGKLEVRRRGGPRRSASDVVWYRITGRRRAIVLCPYPQLPLARRSPRALRLVLDQTGAFGVLALVGPEAPLVLRRLTHLHELPASGDVAHVAAHVLERDGGYWIVFPQEYGHYLWEVAVDAAEPFGGGPVGVDAIDRERSGEGHLLPEARSGAATS